MVIIQSYGVSFSFFFYNKKPLVVCVGSIGVNIYMKLIGGLLYDCIFFVFGMRVACGSDDCCRVLPNRPFSSFPPA